MMRQLLQPAQSASSVSRRTVQQIGAFLLGFTLLSVPASAGEIIENSALNYTAYIPAASASGQKPPVLVALPGYGLSASHTVNDWAFSAEQNGFATLSIGVDYDQVSRIGDLERRIEKALADLAASRSVDAQRVVIAGTAVGGAAAISLGLAYPERYNAVAVAGGGTLQSVDWSGLSNARKQTFFMVHGALNRYIPVAEFNATVKHLKEYGARVESEVFPESDHLLPSHVYDRLISGLSTALAE